MAYGTNYLKKELVKQHDISDFMQYLSNFAAERIDWKKYINEVLLPLDTSYEKIAKKIGFSKGTVRKWCIDGELPQNRDAFIKLAFALNMDIEQTNRLLKVYGHYSELYAKDINDIIIMYVIKKRNEDPENERYSYDSLKYWYERYKEKICEYHHNTNDQYYLDISTVGLYEKAQLIQEEEEFEKFIEMNQLIFLSTYSGLVDYLDTFIKIRMKEYEAKSFHQLAGLIGINARYERILANLRTNGVLPKRMELIFFGIHLNMTMEEIDILLKKANMKELYVRDKMDCILIHFLNEAVQNNPDLLINNTFKMEQLTRDPFIRKKCSEMIEHIMQIDYDEESVEIEVIAEYIRKTLNNLIFLDEDERKEFMELLEK